MSECARDELQVAIHVTDRVPWCWSCCVLVTVTVSSWWTTSQGTLKRGSVYVILARMEEKGFVESRQEARPAKVGGVPRRIYRATEYGLKVHDAFALLNDALALKPAEAQ